MGRSLDLRHRLGVRTDRDRRGGKNPAGNSAAGNRKKTHHLNPRGARGGGRGKPLLVGRGEGGVAPEWAARGAGDAAPDVILASWCGKKVLPQRIRQRPGWSDIPAVRNNRIVEIKSPLILQPGPAALTDGLDAVIKALWP